MTVYGVVKKLLGEIEPVGESNVDEKRLENVKEYISLLANLLHDLRSIAPYKDRQEHSIGLIGQKAYDSLNELGVEV